MYRPPFHRRILPWVFTVVFIVAAPALIFYTAGYRWNPKKNKIERNGTMIVDTQPAGARIILNGKDSKEKTPVTLQNITPGQYQIRLEKDGYHPWEKRLDVFPERVTFANGVWLWKISEPVRFLEGSYRKIEASPNDKRLALVEMTATTATLRILDLENDEELRLSIPNYYRPGYALTWSDDSRSLLVSHAEYGCSRTCFLNDRSGSGLIGLPSGHYRWNGSLLEGTTETSQIAIPVRTSHGSIAVNPLPHGAEDAYDDIAIRHATGTDNLVLFKENNPQRGLILPPGKWRVEEAIGTYLILRDADQWISLDPDISEPVIHRATGDKLRRIEIGNLDYYLFISGGEVWMWNPAQDPELLLRESRPVTNATWHESGRNIVLAVNNTVFTLNLDVRDGRLRTELATFETLHDIALVDNTLYITGRKNGDEGIWKLAIE